MSKLPYKKISFKVFSLALLLCLVSCGASEQVITPDESVEATSETTAETTEAPVTEENPTSETVPETQIQTPVSKPAASTEPVTRPAPVALAKKDCGQMVTQLDMNQCAAENYQISDKALNQVYQDVRQELSDTAKSQLMTAEERWLVFRDAQCTFESDRFEGGSIAPLIQASCMEQITDNRIAELKQSDQTELSYADADAQLNAVYQELQVLVSGSEGDALTDVQLSWLDYRDAHCEYEVNLPTASDKNACLAAVTETRVWQLQTLKDELAL
ncbi:MAG: DUF1311 domain-containing protein [Leptolyngbya sp. SIO3F4]|nr:DUF1311 domain-containing protein [Leptolyngbya sp. SIO3F4]